MYIQQHKINIILNHNFPLFGMLCFCCVIYLGFICNYWFLIFLLLVPLAFLKHKVNKYQIIMIVSILLIFIILTAFASRFSIIDLINKRPKFTRNAILNFFDNHYSKEISSFIKLILFSIKSNESWVFYKQTVDLGVVWLICISGFHISLMSRIIKWIFKKRPKLGKYIDIVIIGFYSFLLNFSYASLRILLKLCYEYVFYKFNIKKFDKLGLIGITLCLLNPKCFVNYGFLLSFTICSLTYFVSKLNLNNKVISTLLINLFASLLSIPFLVEMNHKISLLTFINTFVFSYFSIIIFLYFLIFCLMPFMAIIHNWVMIATYVLVGNISFSNIFLYLQSWPIWGIFIYYGGIIGILNVVYLIVYNNKI